jgi:glycosyltransferase involved in cell wall biosynthesis
MSLSAAIKAKAVQPSPSLDGRLHGVDVVIPAYNEELVIGSLVLTATQLVEKVIVVDDGSTDSTSYLAYLGGADVIHLGKNMGKAHALLVGLKEAYNSGCTVAVTLDGDGQHAPQEILKIVQPVLDGKADLVIGSRFISKKNGVPMHRRLGQKTLDIFTSIGSGRACSDSQSGYRAFSRKALANLDFYTTGYSIESDMIAHFAARGLAIMEVPISVRYDVPHKHKKNPMTHGMSVLGKIINLISYRRPLLAFAIPGFILFVIGLIAGSFAFAEYYITSKFHFPLTMISMILVLVGILLITVGLILNALIYVMKESQSRWVQAAEGH